MAINRKASIEDISPEQRKITKIQAKRLAAMSGIKIKDIEGMNIANIAERLKWKIDPALFLFHKICGKVVKKDPITGEEYPVPFATVYVEDTDCSVISYFPPSWPWGWHFPFLCHREIIASIKTDECGNFCVWVPRFEIDWIIKWRHERICYPIIFQRPLLSDIIPHLPPDGPWPPIPGPDPGPLKTINTLSHSTIEAIVGKSAGKLAQQITRSQSFGAQNKEGLLNLRAFETELPPPLPTEFHQALSGHKNVIAAKTASAVEGIRSAVAMKVGIDPASKDFANFNPNKFIGPFLRCVDIFVPEWQIIPDVPDITFRVTQDTNGDGVEETIYSEGFFDVRWNANTIPDVKLVASQIAKEAHTCQTPTVPCGNVPAILFAGLMPLTNTSYFDSSAGSGYALRPNRPSNTIPPGTPAMRPVAQTPFCGTLQLYGCVNVNNAKFYRVLQKPEGASNFSTITGIHWNLYTVPGGTPVPVTPDPSGWYNVITNPSAYHPENMIIEWPTPPLAKTTLKIEIADASKNHIAYSDEVTIQTDNTYPSAIFSRLAWKFAGEPDTALRNLLGIPCPTIHRGTTPADIEVAFEVQVSAHHLRDASIWTSGCGGGNFDFLSGMTSHWHANTSDNAVFLHGRYTLSHNSLEGAYGFHCNVNSRAMNPAGSDNGHLFDWLYDPNYIHIYPEINVAVVDQNP